MFAEFQAFNCLSVVAFDIAQINCVCFSIARLTQTLCKRSSAAAFSIRNISPLLYARADRGDAAAIRRLLALVESLVSASAALARQQHGASAGPSASTSGNSPDFSCPPKVLGALAAAVEAAGNGDGATELRKMQRSVQLAQTQRSRVL